MMQLVGCGTKVKGKDLNIEGSVRSISIRFDAVAYEIQFLNAGKFETVWLTRNEFEITEGGEKLKVGFKK